MMVAASRQRVSSLFAASALVVKRPADAMGHASTENERKNIARHGRPFRRLRGSETLGRHPPKAQSVERAMGPENWRGSRPMVSARIVVQMRRSSVISQGPTPTLEESHVKGTSCRSTPGKHGAEPGPCRPGSVQSRAYEADGRDDC